MHFFLYSYQKRWTKWLTFEYLGPICQQLHDLTPVNFVASVATGGPGETSKSRATLLRESREKNNENVSKQSDNEKLQKSLIDELHSMDRSFNATTKQMMDILLLSLKHQTKRLSDNELTEGIEKCESFQQNIIEIVDSLVNLKQLHSDGSGYTKKKYEVVVDHNRRCLSCTAGYFGSYSDKTVIKFDTFSWQSYQIL